MNAPADTAMPVRARTKLVRARTKLVKARTKLVGARMKGTASRHRFVRFRQQLGPNVNGKVNA